MIHCCYEGRRLPNETKFRDKISQGQPRDTVSQ